MTSRPGEANHGGFSDTGLGLINDISALENRNHDEARYYLDNSSASFGALGFLCGVVVSILGLGVSVFWVLDFLWGDGGWVG